MRTLSIVSVVCASVVACGGSDTPPGGGTGNKASGSESDSGAASSGGGTDKSPGDGGGGASEAKAAALAVVFNEVAAVGSTEWIEIANRGQAVVDLADFFLADSEKSTSDPKKSDAMRFPAGTKLDPGGRIVILASKKNGTVGPHPRADCLPDGPDTCFYASFGVSATSGETIHLLAPDGSVVTSTAIPKSLSADAGGSTAETQCRLPDLTGDFGKCAPTPGSPNRAP